MTVLDNGDFRYVLSVNDYAVGVVCRSELTRLPRSDKD